MPIAQITSQSRLQLLLSNLKRKLAVETGTIDNVRIVDDAENVDDVEIVDDAENVDDVGIADDAFSRLGLSLNLRQICTKFIYMK